MNEFFNELRLFRKGIIKTLKEIKLSQYDPMFFHETIVTNTTYAPWRTDTAFMETYEIAKTHTLVDMYRSYNLWAMVKETNNVEGDILEVGVWKGGTACILGTASEGKGTVFLADTFKGVVKAGTQDTFYKGGEHADSTEDEVKELLSRKSIKNYSILTGIFPDDFLNMVDKKKFRFCHIDVDVYQSSKDIFYYIWPRMTVNGVVVFDDYGFLGCEGVTKMVDEISLPDAVKIYNLTGQAVIVKTR